MVNILSKSKSSEGELFESRTLYSSVVWMVIFSSLKGSGSSDSNLLVFCAIVMDPPNCSSDLINVFSSRMHFEVGSVGVKALILC